MEQYISKSAVVAEIKELIRANELYLSEPKTDEIRFQKIGAYSVLNDLLHFLDTLEVKEVNLAKEIKDWFLNGNITDTRFDTYYDGDIENTAKHFFELGLKAHKVQDEIKIGETKIYLEDDGGEPE